MKLKNELKRLKRLERELKNPDLQSVLSCLQNTELEENQRIFSVRSNRGSLSLIVTTRLLLELFIDLCGNNEDYEPFYSDIKFKVGPFFGYIVAAKNVMVKKEPATPFFIMVTTHHTYLKIRHCWNDVAEIVGPKNIRKLMVGIVDCEAGLISGILDGIKDNGGNVELFLCEIHRKRSIRYWLKDNKGRFTVEERKSFLNDTTGKSSIYRGNTNFYIDQVMERKDTWGNTILRYFKRQWYKKFVHIISSNKRKHGIPENITNNLIESINSMIRFLLDSENLSPVDAIVACVVFISSVNNMFKRVVLGGGNTEFKEEYEEVRQKYASKLETTFTVDHHVLTYTYDTSEEIRKSSVQIEKILLCELFPGELKSLPRQIRKLIFGIACDVATCQVNKLYSCRVSQNMGNISVYVYCVYDWKKMVNVEVRIILIFSGKKARVKSICSIHGEDSFCSHSAFVMVTSEREECLVGLFKSLNPYKELRKRCSVSSGKKPGRNTRRRKRKKKGFLARLFALLE